MTDHFAVLRQPRRPWLDPDQLKEEYRRIAFEEHPDRKNESGVRESRGAEAPPTSEAPILAAVNEAYRVLSNPRLRLQHLLSLAGHDTPESNEVTPELADMFMKTAALVREVEAFLQKRDRIASALGKSLLQTETRSLQNRADDISQQLQRFYADAMTDLRAADQVFSVDSGNAVKELRRLAQRFGYLDRWIVQVREKQFQLSS